ncbi:MAG: hypothetical protein J4F28_02095 [Nitrosopumilaceae archaeon]|nr:hypothetical protein [Nitrosopumilaceae archaeon]
MTSNTLERELVKRGRDYYYCIGSSYVKAVNQNVSVPIPEGADDDGDDPESSYPPYPRCPDCGGHVMWHGSITVRGGRLCGICYSRFADMRYHGQTPGQYMPDAGADTAVVKNRHGAHSGKNTHMSKVEPSPDLVRKWKEAVANYVGLIIKYNKIMRGGAMGGATLDDIRSMDTLTSALANRIISCMTMLVREAREAAAASTSAAKTTAVLDSLYYGRAQADTRVVRRCWFCGVPLPFQIEVPKSDENRRYTIACDSCTRLIDKGLPDAPFGMFRECECGHDLGDHSPTDDETEAPSPCDECECADWKEKAGE